MDFVAESPVNQDPFVRGTMDTGQYETLELKFAAHGTTPVKGNDDDLHTLHNPEASLAVIRRRQAVAHLGFPDNDIPEVVVFPQHFPTGSNMGAADQRTHQMVWTGSPSYQPHQTSSNAISSVTLVSEE